MHTWKAVTLTGLLVACAPAPARVDAPSIPDRLVELPIMETVRVVVMGDQGTGTPEQLAVANAMQFVCREAGCDLGVGLGDNFYPRGPASEHSPLFQERFADLYGPLNIPFLMITGNHDESLLWGGDGASPGGADVQINYAKLNPQWIMPGRFYRAVTGELLEVLAVDTTPLASYLPSQRVQERPGGSWESAQRNWLTQHARSSETQWTVVLGHHPLFSNAKHGNAGAFDHLPFNLQRGAAVRTLYQSVCSNVDVIFSGHDHALQLFAPQPECPGTWQVVSGAAGHAEGQGQVKHPAQFQEFNLPGFTWMQVTKQELLLRFYTVNRDGQPTLAFEQVIRK